MAELDSSLQEKTSQSVDADSRVFCPSCKEAYWWVYGEDYTPTSLSCGHSLCLKCAKGQWSNPDSGNTSVFCVTCSEQVGITTYKCPPSSLAENNNASSCLPMELETSAMNNGGVAEQSTPTHLRSYSSVTHHSTSEGQHQPSSVAYNSAERVTSALSSPMVLDKIQSQDDAWRLLQHDEGFIRDWIVANVPDHVIFKMVGAGNPDAVIATSVDSNSFVFSSGSTVVISSPPKTADTTLTTAKAAGPGSSSTLPGVSTLVGESSTNRASFEQQFLHYLVNKTSHDRLTEDDGEQDLQAAPGTVDSNTQQEAMVDDVMGLTVVSATSQIKATPTESLIQGMDHAKPAGGVGNKGDCRIQPDKESQTLGASVITRMTADGEASQLAATNRAVLTEVEGRRVLAPNVGDMPTETAAFGPDLAAHQCLPGLEQQHTGYSPLPPCGGPPFPPPLAQNPIGQQNYTSAVPGNTIRYSSYPRRARFPAGGMAGTSGPTTPASYDTYLYPYPHHAYPLHDQYRTQYAVPRRYAPAIFPRFPQHVAAHRGTRFSRGRNASFPRPLRSPHEYSWYSKACSTSISQSPAPRVTSQPQIRVVQVLRPKTETQGQWGEGSTEDKGSGGKEPLPGTGNSEATTAEEQEAAEVAVMKTRAMPHGAQVEDIYVVPQVWLSAGQAPSPPASPTHSKCPACPYPPSRPPHRDPALNVPAAASAVHPETVCVVNSSFPIKSEPTTADRYTPSTVVVQNFSDSAGSQDVKQASFENQDLVENAGSHFEVVPDATQPIKNNTEDSSDYTDFQPVALVTVSRTKMKPDELEAAPATAVTQDALAGGANIHTSILSGSSTAASSNGPWEQSEETPVMKMAALSGMHSSLMHVPPAPTKKQDVNVLQRKNAVAKLPHCESSRSAVTLGNYVGTCNKTVQDALDSELARNAVAEGQADPYMDGLEVVETKSSVPAAIMLPKPDTATFLPARKKLRRNLAAEFYNSSLGEQGQGQTSEFVPVTRRARGRRGRRCPSTNYSLYRSGMDGNQPSVYPFTPPYNYDPHAYGLYDDQAPLHNSCLRYGPAPPSVTTAAYPSNPGKPVDPNLGLTEDLGHTGRHSATHHPLLHRVSAVTGGYPLSGGPVSPTQPFPEPHVSSGQGDYSSSYEEQGLHYDYVQDDRALYGINTDLVCRSGGLPRQDGTNSRLHVRPVRRGRGTWMEGHGHAGDWKIGATGHTIRADELDTIHWLLREVTELKKQINNEVLTSLQGCLSLLERNAYQECNASRPMVPQGREVSDLDHLLRCILSLGQVAVHFGWWCRPHHWDHNSERWGEMALLASQVFGESIHKLNQILTFYLDHVCATKGNDSLAQLERKEAAVDTVKLEDSLAAGIEASQPDQSPCQIQYGQKVTLRDLPCTSVAPASPPKSYTTTAASQLETYAPAVGHSESYTRAVSQGESYAIAVSHLEAYTTVGDQSESCDTEGDQLESYALVGDQFETCTTVGEQPESFSTADAQSEPYATVGDQVESYATVIVTPSESFAAADSQLESYTTTGDRSESFGIAASKLKSYTSSDDPSESCVTVINQLESYSTASEQLESSATGFRLSDADTPVNQPEASAKVSKQSEVCTTIVNEEDVTAANLSKPCARDADQFDSCTKDDDSEACDTGESGVQMYAVIFREAPAQCSNEDDKRETSGVKHDQSQASAHSSLSEEYTKNLHQLPQDSVPCKLSALYTSEMEQISKHMSDTNDPEANTENAAATTNYHQGHSDGVDEKSVDNTSLAGPASEATTVKTNTEHFDYKQLHIFCSKGVVLDNSTPKKQSENGGCHIKEDASDENISPTAAHTITSAQQLQEEVCEAPETLQASEREGEICENSIVYTLPYVAEDLPGEFTTVADSQPLEPFEDTHDSAEVSQCPTEISTSESLSGVPAVWEDPADVECLIICHTAELDRPFQSFTPCTDTIPSTAELENPDLITDGSDSAILTQTDQPDSSMPCFKKEVMSDATCLKTDVEMNEQNVGLDPGEATLSEENSSDTRGNGDADVSITKKRKSSKTVHSKSKYIKLDTDSGKETQKRTSKGEKWNLRSSRSSPSKCRHSPKSSSKKL